MKIRFTYLLIFFLFLDLVSCEYATSTIDKENNNENIDNKENDNDNKDLSKSIVIYFSATGTTKKVAEKIQSVTASDIYEIVPKELYTEADLNYNDASSRTSLEQNDAASRPLIGSSTIDLSGYDVIYLGYPIWWGQAPKIMYTFVENYDLSNKTIYPFVTSASSGVGSSATNLSKSAKGGTWKSGVRFTTSVSESDILNWVGK